MSNVYLAKDIYSKESIEATITAFANYAKIMISHNKTHYICTFENAIYDVEETMKEFENYLIDYCNKLDF